MEELRSLETETGTVINLTKSWKTADCQRKKAVAMILKHKILISEDGGAKIIWNMGEKAVRARTLAAYVLQRSSFPGAMLFLDRRCFRGLQFAQRVAYREGVL